MSPDKDSAELSKDHHSYSNPSELRTSHVTLDLEVSFASKELRGTATLSLERADGYSGPLRLDTRDLRISRVESSADGSSFQPVQYSLGKNDPALGAPLIIDLPAKAVTARIHYRTSPAASGLQWLTAEQTAGKQYPFLFSQSQAIHARSWIPLQDSPGVRVTYSARIKTAPQLLAVMSAKNDPSPAIRGDYRFEMNQAIPSYLIALAVGDIDYRSMTKRTGVYAEKPVVERAAKEFIDTERMIEAAETLFGPYRWERYDLLVLPPSFPFGGMENPGLTFATPTILAGDKSLVSLVAHELAHSWSGNLVTNATWRDFWLNEGFTVYCENRIQERVYGKARSEMEAALERDELEREMRTLEPRDQILHVDLRGRNPDDGFTQVPYVKGMLLLRRLEEVFGRAKFDGFLKAYFSQFAFRSITTEDFRAFLKERLLDPNPGLARQVSLDEWIEKPGLPADAPKPSSAAFTSVSAEAQSWLSGQTGTAELPVSGWTTQEWLHFLRSLPERVEPDRMAELDRAFGLTSSGNAEILAQWLLMSIRSKYQPAEAKTQEFLTTVGRRKFLKPLYEELVKTEAGRARAKAIYADARAGYHPIAQATVDGILK